jgi:hypothetical protein
MALFLRNILKKRNSDETFRVNYLPFSSPPKFKWKKRQPHERAGMPSIYIPPEVKRTDISDMYYPAEYFETRVERNKRLDIEKQLENENDPVKRDELKKKLPEDKYLTK